MAVGNQHRVEEEFSKWQLVRNIVEQSTDASEAEQAVVEVLNALISPDDLIREDGDVVAGRVLDAIASAYCVRFQEGEDG